MSIDPCAKRFLDRLAASSPPSAKSLSVDSRRNALAELLGFASDAPFTAEGENRVFPGPAGQLSVRLYAAEAGRSVGPGLIYFHGGGLVAGSLDTHDAICRRLAQASDCRVVSVAYRLAPENPFPAALEDGVTAVRWVFEHAKELRMDPYRIAIGGDSAGATLATVVCQELAVAAFVRPALQFLLCPITDFCASTRSRREFGAGYFLDQATLDHDLVHYLAGIADPTDPRVSPLRAPDVSQLPPACIHTAEFDPLRDEGWQYAERLHNAGVETLYRCHAGMIHMFYGMTQLIPYAAIAIEQMGDDIRSMLAGRHMKGTV